MTELVANEYCQNFPTRLPNEYLISSGIYFSRPAYRLLMLDILNKNLVEGAISENQFSTGAMNRLYEFTNRADSSDKRNPTKLSVLVKRWLATLDLQKSVID